MRGFLYRHIPVRLVNVSPSGFLLTCNEQMAEGTTGDLRVSIDGALRHSPARVAHLRSLPYAIDRFLLAGTFDTQDGPQPESLSGMANTRERPMPPSVQAVRQRRWQRYNKLAQR